MQKEEFLKKVEAIESPVKGSFYSGNSDIDKYITSKSDLQAIAEWIPQNNIYSVIIDDSKEYSIVAGFLNSSVGYIICSIPYSRNERNNVVLKFK